MAKKEAFLQFLKAARSLQNRGLSKEAIVQFAKNEFGEINELFKKQIDNIFKPKKGIENIKIKDSDFDDTVIKMQFDEFGPFNPKDPLKNLSKQTEGVENISIEERMEKIKGASNRIDEIMKEREEMYRPKKTDDFNLSEDDPLGDLEKIIRGEGDTGLPKKPRDKKYTGGMVEVEPSLSDIGHGSDALMARTRLVAPNSQATTSTGLNYLLAEDNDNIRVPFENGGDMQSKIDEMIGHYQRYLKMPGKQKRKIPLKKFAEMFATENFAEGGRIGFANGNGVADEDAEKAALGKRVNQLMDEGFDFGEAVKQAMSEGYAEGGRIGFSKGKIAKEVLDKGRRGFMKAAGAAGAGIAALKTGLLGFGEKAAPVVETAVETVKETAKGVPPYFFRLVEKIKFMGDDITEKAATQDRQVVKKYKDYEMTEDLGTGDIVIKKRNEGSFYDQDGIISDEYIVYKPGQADEMTKGKRPPDEYEEYTVRPDAEGKLRDTEGGLDSIDEILEEVGDLDAMTLKKAEGGRIGFAGGKLAINAGRKFLEKVFGKEKLKNIVDNDPELEQGMLEVVEMFRNKDKEGLKMYLQKYLPHMDDAEIEDFIVGSGDTAGIEGQLIRLGSGRDYKGKIDMIEEANNVRKLENFDVEGVSKNAEGGRIGLFLGGGLKAGKGLLRSMLNFMAEKATHGKKGSEMLQLVNPKQLDKYLNDPATMGKVSPEAPAGIPEIINAKKKEMTEDRSNMVGDLIGTARRIKKVDDDIMNYKKTITNEMIGRGIDPETAAEMAENLAEMVAKDAGKKASPNITDQGLLELENIQKNLLTKDRKLQAQGGLTTMLGE